MLQPVEFPVQTLTPLAHGLIGEGLCPDAEEGRIVGQRMIDLEISHTPSHHDIGHGMGLGEHVLDLLAASHVPFGHIMLGHHILPAAPFIAFSGGHFALPDIFHDTEGIPRREPHMHQIYHDIVTAADGRGQLAGACLDQILGISQPHIRTVGQSGDPYQIREILRIRIDHHLHGEVRSELRDSQGPEGCAIDILRRDPQRLRSVEEGHYLLVVQRNRLRIQSRQILQPSDHGGIVVSEDIEFQKVMIDGMIFKMCRHLIRRLVIRRLLDRCETVDLLRIRCNDDTSRVLAGGTLYAQTMLHDAVHFRLSHGDSTPLTETLDITEHRLLRIGGDSPRTEGMVLTEHLTDKGVSPGLVIAGEVKIDIRLLISLKPEEGLEGDIMPLLDQLVTAFRTVTIRHVTSGHARISLHLFGIKIHKMTLRTDIVG